MKHSFLVAGALASSVGLLGSARDATACSRVGTPDLALATEGGAVPIDAPLFVTTSEAVRPGTLRVEAKAANGSAVDLVDAPSATEKGVHVLRPAAGGALPAGTLSLVFRFETERGNGEQEIAKSIDVRGSLADYRLVLHDAKIVSQIVPESGAPKISCAHAPIVGSCGGEEETVSEIAARWRRVPVMSVANDDPPWAAALFERTQIWTARHADGTIEEKRVEGGGAGAAFDAPGVEYCVEVTMTPRAGVATTVRSAATCVANGDTRFEWTDAENDAQITTMAENLGCGTDGEAANDSEGGIEGGCAIARRDVGGTQRPVVVSALAVGIIAAAARRRSRRG